MTPFNLVLDQTETTFAYRRRLSQRILNLRRKGIVEFDRILPLLNGAYPTVVASEIKDLYIKGLASLKSMPGVSSIKTSHRISPLSKREQQLLTDLISSFPEPHPVYYEWYYDFNTLHFLTLRENFKDKTIAFLGCPRAFTIFEMRKIGKRRVLFDINERGLQSIRQTFPNSIVVSYDAFEPMYREFRKRFDLVIFDPPWYPDHFAVWLERALALIDEGGLYFPLWGDLVRESAQYERQWIRNTLQSYGFALRSPIIRALSYETPLFERISLEANDLSPPLDWRRADLQIAYGRPRGRRISKIKRPKDVFIWTNYQLGKQIVMTRQVQAIRHMKPDLSGIYDDASFICKSVSRRDPRRERIGIWTSRNRVFQATPINIFNHILSRLQAGSTIDNAFEQISKRGSLDSKLLTEIKKTIDGEIMNPTRSA